VGVSARVCVCVCVCSILTINLSFYFFKKANEAVGGVKVLSKADLIAENKALKAKIAELEAKLAAK